MNLELVRFAYSQDATLGQLSVGDSQLCTLEEPWRRNPKGLGGQRRDLKAGILESCVPDGEYILKPHSGTLFKAVWRLSNPALGVYDFADQMPSREWGRASVLIHNGNTTDDIIGCVLVGLIHSRLDGKPAVLRSGEALALLRAQLGVTAIHRLLIRPTAGTQ